MNKSVFGKILLVLVGVAMSACAATIDESVLKEKTSVATGVNVSQITIMAEDTVAAGTERQWSAKTSDGKIYKCSVKRAAWLSSKAECTDAKK